MTGLPASLRLSDRRANVQWGMWDRKLNPLDRLIVGATLLLAGLTLWAWSYPIPGTDAFYFALFAWSIVAIAWASSLIATTIATTTGTPARAASLLLLLGAVASFPFAGVSLILIELGGAPALGLIVVTGLCLLGVVVGTSPVKRVAWLVAPGVVLAMFAVMSTGVPRLTRMAFAEPALNAFTQNVDPTATLDHPMWFDEGIAVGSIPVYEAYTRRGAVHLVTGYVGILADDNAGIAYFPSGAPATDWPYEHLVGAWYRWYPGVEYDEPTGV